MCYHRHLHFVPCNHIFSLDVVRFCASARAMDASPPSSSTSASSASPTSTARSSKKGLRPCGTCLAHPCTTYKVQRLCGVCEERRAEMQERLARLKSELRGVRERVERLEREYAEERKDGEKAEKAEVETVETAEWEEVEESLEEMGREVCRWEKMGWSREEEDMVVPVDFDELDEE